MATERRVTVNLDRRGAESLDRISEATGYNNTDVTNRAYALYATYEDARADGAELVLRYPDGREIVIRIL